MTLFVRVKKKQAQKVRNELLEKGLLDLDYDLIKKYDLIFIPVRERVDNLEIVDLDVKKRVLEPRSIRDALEGVLSDKELDLVPRRFDLIGDVAVLDIPDEILEKSQLIAEAVVRVHPRIKTVCRESGFTSGVFRLKPVEVILGKDTVTEYKEFGLRMKLDVESVYFSPRLSSDRLRIAKQVKSGERVLVMFAGVGPYALVIAKHQPQAEVVGVEINPVAVSFMRENVLLNKLGNIEVFEGDVREVVTQLGMFDRVLMPLPKDAGEFLNLTKQVLKKGGVVHFYSFSERLNPFNPSIKRIKQVFPQAKILYKGITSNISPAKVRVVIDFQG